ncbi:tetratricopeptide repeat protein [Flammeovirga pectinis]|uniref:Tetratricopeptide repeat protein n=1 Tax=Flammeovirga pectinis TaxID=2494373 RepID=A0A3S9P1V0_9BACT|nr:tetratricopeptide repeat protein [Flammeovirga pectinis]AZQ62132.1 tetratricopeptide repeat protein [Flammeovirga pectinis]
MISHFKNIKIDLLTSCLVLLLFSNNLSAQESLYYSDNVKLFNKAIVLYNENNFSAARREFELFESKHCGEDEKCVEAHFYIAVCNLELQHPEAKSQIESFVNTYPVHPLSVKAYKVLGSYYFEKGEYEKALAAFDKDPYFDFYDDDDIKIAYQAAYSNFDQGKTKEANKLFQVLKKGTHPYALKSSYYAGYIEYDQKEYEQSIKDLEKSLSDKEISTYTYSILPLAYYALGQEDKMLALVKDAKSKGIHLPTDALLFTGKVYYTKKDYATALIYFNDYLAEVPVQVIDRNTAYQIGFTNYKEGFPEKAVQPLSVASDGNDELAQIAAYDLGAVSIELNQKDKALLAFEKSRKLSFNKEIQKQASYNFIKVQFELGLYTQVGDACELFLFDFPDSEYDSEVHEYLQISYVNSGDYNKALEVFDRIGVNNEETKQAYQEAAFNKAVENANDNNARGAIDMLLKSQKYPMSDEIYDASNFWLGETYTSISQLDSAITAYDEVPNDSKFHVASLFGRGYAFYAKQEYQLGIDYFTKYINLGRKEKEAREKVAEAVLRRADCYFGISNYHVAQRSYDMAISAGSKDVAYINYQKAQTYRALGSNNDEAFRMYQQVGEKYGETPFAPLSYFQSGLMMAEADRNGEAISQFTKVISRYEKTNVYVPSLLKRALCYKLEGELDNAETDYKNVIDTAPTSKFAEAAITSLQGLNASGHVISDMALYRHKFDEANPMSTATLQGDFEMAIKPFQEKNYDQAIISLNDFLVKAPVNSSVADEANQALGITYKIKDQKELAIASFQKVNGMPLKEKALRYIGELQLMLEKYDDAIVTFVELEKVAIRKTSKWAVYVGLMKAEFQVKDYSACKAYATKIIDQNIKRYVFEAELYLAKIDLEEKKYTNALTSFDAIANKANSQIGAEAQYLLGKTFRVMENYNESTKALIEVQKNYASYSEWINKAYLLIAENYISLNDLFQAKATLESIISGSDIPEYKVQAAQRLKDIEQLKTNSTPTPTKENQ